MCWRRSKLALLGTQRGQDSKSFGNGAFLKACACPPPAAKRRQRSPTLRTIAIGANGLGPGSDSFRFLVHSSRWHGDARTVSKEILDTLVGDDDKYQIGLSKIFLRAGQVPKARVATCPQRHRTAHSPRPCAWPRSAGTPSSSQSLTNCWQTVCAHAPSCFKRTSTCGLSASGTGGCAQAPSSFNDVRLCRRATACRSGVAIP